MSKEVADIAQIRGDAHPNRSKRFFDDPNTEDLIGAAGELAFARAFGFQVDRSSRPLGDRGIDFTTSVNGVPMTIDVKTYRLPYHLLVKVSEINNCADVLVLAQFDYGMVSLLGWEHRNMMRKSPTNDFGRGIVSHFRLRHQLRPMDQLVDILTMRDF
jgi:hypothetical protein